MRIIIVDDHPLVRKGLASLLSVDPDMKMVGEASCTQKAVELIVDAQPDIALVDLRLGKENGLDIVNLCRKQNLSCKFIIITSSADYIDFHKAKNLGVNGYILKDALPEEILYAVRLVDKGRLYYDPTMMNSTFDNTNSLIDQLTPREKEVLAALGRGLKNCEIAKNLFVTEFTVKKYVSQIFDKLDLQDRTKAALYAVNNGMVG